MNLDLVPSISSSFDRDQGCRDRGCFDFSMGASVYTMPRQGLRLPCLLILPVPIPKPLTA